MNYKTLGNIGLTVSEICLGTMTFGSSFYNKMSQLKDTLGAAKIELSSKEFSRIAEVTKPKDIYSQWMVKRKHGEEDINTKKRSLHTVTVRLQTASNMLPEKPQASVKKREHLH